MAVAAPAAALRRWELYRLLSDPVRLRLLALASAEELSVGELSVLLGESQPKVSRQGKALREAGLLSLRRQGTRTLLRLTEGVASDPVVGDALDAGQRLAEEDGSLARVGEVLGARDEATRAFFDRQDGDGAGPHLAPELPAYLSALAPLVEARRLAVDAGTGDGRLLDVLAPVFGRVVAFDRSEPQLARARHRVAARGYDHVEVLAGELEDPEVRRRVDALGGADAVFAARVLHHAPRPAAALAALARLARPGGALVVIDYAAHDDEGMRESQADLWLGFDDDELRALATRGGLTAPVVRRIPACRCGDGPDGHLDWQVLVGRVPHDDGERGSPRTTR